MMEYVALARWLEFAAMAAFVGLMLGAYLALYLGLVYGAFSPPRAPDA